MSRFSLGFAEVFIGLQAYAVAVVGGLRRVRERISIGNGMLDIYNSYTRRRYAPSPSSGRGIFQFSNSFKIEKIEKI